MEILVDESVLKKLDDNYIFHARTGMLGQRESSIHRWKKGEKLFFEAGCMIEPYTTIAEGNNLFTCGSFSSISSSLRTNAVVGRYVGIGEGCKMMGFRHPVESVSMNSAMFNFAREYVDAYFEQYEAVNGSVPKISVPTPQPQDKPLVVGNDVWIGNDCTLRGGITIHTGAIVASKSVVLEDVPPYAVVAGVPAKVKKYRFERSIIDGLLESRWWEYELGDMYREGLDFSSPSKFLERYAEVKGRLRRYVPTPFIPKTDFMREFPKNLSRVLPTSHAPKESPLLTRYKRYEEYFRDFVAKDKTPILKDFLRKKQVNHVALYGLNEISKGLLPLLKRLGIIIDYAIEDYRIDNEIKVIARNAEALPSTDCLIICDLRVLTIRRKLARLNLPFMVTDLYEMVGEREIYDESKLY